MLNLEKITREELYEAVWAESVQKLAVKLGISDVGLAKIARKLKVPLPGRGYWAKGPVTRRYLRVPFANIICACDDSEWKINARS